MWHCVHYVFPFIVIIFFLFVVNSQQEFENQAYILFARMIVLYVNIRTIATINEGQGKWNEQHNKTKTQLMSKIALHKRSHEHIYFIDVAVFAFHVEATTKHSYTVLPVHECEVY